VTPASERPTRGRRVGLGIGFLVVFLFSLGVFLLPFAFPTEGAIVARFASEAQFSPNTPGGRPVTRIAVLMRDAGTLQVVVTRGSQVIRTLIPLTKVRKGWVISSWNGTSQGGARMPDGSYTIELTATSGRKGYNASRRATINRVRPPGPAVTATSAGGAELPVPAQCAISATPSTYARIIFVAEQLPGGHVIDGPHFVDQGAAQIWDWNGRGQHAGVLPAGVYRITVETVSVNGFQFMTQRECWIGNLLGTLTAPAASSGALAQVHLRLPSGGALPPATPVVLSILRRTGTPGAVGSFVGRSLGAPVSTTAGAAEIRLPAHIPLADLWVEARTAGGIALIAAGNRP
jgi:hypothetical protein